MKLIDLDGFWINPDNVYAVCQGSGENRTNIFMGPGDEDYVRINLPLNDVIGRLTSE